MDLSADSQPGTLAPNKDGPSVSPNAANNEDEYENPSRPKGVRFVVLFLSILAGDFFVGYVRRRI